MFGVEGDIQATGANDTFAPWKFSNPWFGTVRGRVGYAFNNIMFFGTGGLAFGELRGETFGLSETHTRAGWTVGAGTEFGLTQNWSAKIEYLYVDLANYQLHHHRHVERLPVRTAARRRELSLLTTRNFCEQKNSYCNLPAASRGRDFFVRDSPPWPGMTRPTDDVASLAHHQPCHEDTPRACMTIGLALRRQSPD